MNDPPDSTTAPGRDAIVAASSGEVLQNARPMDSLRTTGLKVALGASVLLVVALAWVDLRREQARALEDFREEQETHARAFAATLDARLGVVGRALHAAVDAGDGPSRALILRRLIDERALFREADVLDREGAVMLALPVRADRAIEGSPPLRLAREELARRAVQEGTAISGPLSRAPGETPERLRLVATTAEDGRRIVLLLDGERLFDPGVRDASDGALPSTRWLIMDPAAGWIERNGEGGHWSPEDVKPVAEVASLLDGMRAGGHGAVLLGREAAASLGLERRSAVAGHASVDGLGHRWSVAVVASAMRVRDRARVGAWRLVAAAGLASLFAGLLGWVVVRQQRHALGLADELRLAAATAALRERSEKIVDAIPIGVLTVDGALRVRSANPFLAGLGVRIPDGSASLAAVLVDATPDERAALEALLASAHADRRSATRQGLALHLGGALREIDAHAIPLARPLADVDTFLVLDDRTELRALERNLARADKLATIGTLTAGVAHEVGTPLGIISGRAEQLLARVPEGENGDSARKSLRSIIAQVEKVSATIRQLLDFSRVRPIEGTTITPTRMLEGAASLLEHRFRQAKVSLTVEAPASVPAISGDPGQLEQVLVNLLMNAVDACAPGGQVVARAAATDDGSVRITISDDGCGIPKEQLGAVLDPFFTTKKRGQGTGLGLTIAADITRNHGGSLVLESAVGRGTTVRVTLPAAPTTPTKGEPT